MLKELPRSGRHVQGVQWFDQFFRDTLNTKDPVSIYNVQGVQGVQGVYRKFGTTPRGERG
jgi:hypothetical protein